MESYEREKRGSNERKQLLGSIFFFLKSSWNVKIDILGRVCPVTKFVPNA